MSNTLPVTISWINHASYIVQCGDAQLLCDPWLSGTAFNRGWRLLSSTRTPIERLEKVSHVWFSHQHPDHFSPGDLRRLSAEARRSITVLYHETIDQKVVRFCRGLRFKEAVELHKDEWVTISPDLQILCNAWSDGDSWMAVKTPQGTILNLNDCLIESPAQARSISRAVGPVRALFTQFSFANWSGNPDDASYRKAKARKKFDQMRLQIEAFDPQYVIPFASFIWFSHEENFYHNADMNRVHDVASYICDLQKSPVVLYPGDEWVLGCEHDWKLAAVRYNEDLQAVLRDGPADSSMSVDVETILRSAEQYIGRIKRRNPLLRFIPGLRTACHVRDLNRSFAFTLDGIQPIPPDKAVDVVLHSDSLQFMLKMPWGANALSVNGRFIVPKDGDRERFFRFFRAGDLNDHGQAIDYRWALSQAAKRLLRAG